MATLLPLLLHFTTCSEHTTHYIKPTANTPCPADPCLTPMLTLRRGDTTAHSRMNAVNTETMNQYFSLLQDVLEEHGLMDKPSQIYNVDESGVPLDPRPPNVVTVRGTKKVRYRSSGKKGQVTIVSCVSASGQPIPPMIIFDAQNLNHAWTKGEFPGTKYGLSANGWINTDLFEGWLSEHFLEHAVSARPLLLLLDGHSTHYQPQSVRFAKEHDVIMLCLPPHTSHESQPLDCGVFGPLKSQWTKVCHTWYQKNPGKVITRFQFSGLFSQAWAKAISPANIIAGFRTCGVFPFNPKAIKIPGVEDATEKIDTESSTEQASLEGVRGSDHALSLDGARGGSSSDGSRRGSCCTSSLDGPRGVSDHASLDGARSPQATNINKCCGVAQSVL